MKQLQNTKQTILAALLFALCSVLFISCGSSDAKTTSATDSTASKGDAYTLGFIPLTDCASLVMAKELGLFEKYGVNVELSKEASWANVRDKILTGELTGAHCLFGMPFSVYTGVGGKEGSVMKVAMILNNNGQAITLSKDFCGKVGFKQTSKVAGVVAAKLKADKEVTFAMT